MEKTRPKLTARQQVEAMVKKGIRFDLMSEEDAERFLRERNFFFKVKAFEKVFDKFESPDHERFGEYVNLDFTYLVELSRLDKALRFCVMETALDIEHFMKVQMNRAMMDDEDCDAHDIVKQYVAHDANRKLSRIADKGEEHLSRLLESVIKCLDEFDSLDVSSSAESRLDAIRLLDKTKDSIEDALGGLDLHHIEKSISRLSASQYSRRLAGKYGSLGKMAYWNFFELATFGDIIGLYKYYYFELGGGKDLRARRVKQLLFPVRALRNAAAHNSCLLNTMRDRLTKPIGIIAKLLVSEYGMDCELVGLTKRVPLIHDFSATLMCYDVLVSSEHSRSVCARRLRALSERLSRNRSFFTKQAEVDKGLEMLVALCNTFVARFEGQ